MTAAVSLLEVTKPQPRLMLERIVVFVFIVAPLASNAFAKSENDGAVGKVIATYPYRNTTKLILQTMEPLVAGRTVYIGKDFLEVTVDDRLSQSGEIYYYAASVPGKPRIDNGDSVLTERPKALSPPSMLKFTINERYVFSQKKFGEVTAVQGSRAMIDRGSLHEVRERDLYRVYDSSGGYKGMLELRGIGDLQSSGKLYNALEDRRRNAMRTQPGDRVIFAGQRKLFALGLMGGFVPGFQGILTDGRLVSQGLGLLWNVTFPDGWGVEVLFGGYQRQGKGAGSIGSVTTPGFWFTENMDRSVLFIAPIWVKKNFFFPYPVSPFLGVGFSMYKARNQYSFTKRDLAADPWYLQGDQKTEVSGIAPMLGGGIEFFSGRFFRPRIEVRYIRGPDVTALGNTFRTESLFYSFGFLTTW